VQIDGVSSGSFAASSVASIRRMQGARDSMNHGRLSSLASDQGVCLVVFFASFFILDDRRIRIQQPVDEEGIVVAVGRLSSLLAIKNYFTVSTRKLAIFARFAPLPNSRSSMCAAKKKMSFASEKIPTDDDDA